MSVIVHGPSGPQETNLTHEAVFGALCMRKDGATAAIMLRIALDHPGWVVTGVEVLADGVSIAFLDKATGESGTWTAPYCNRTVEEVRRHLVMYNETTAWVYRDGVVREMSVAEAEEEVRRG